MKKYLIFISILFVVLLFIGAPARRIYAPFKYRFLIKEYAERYNLDWLLVASIIYHESRFRPQAVSPKGARGLMQLMPDTAYEVAYKLGLEDVSLEDLFNPKTNLELGCYYFNSILKEFGGRIRFALAAYNAGIGSVYKWSKSQNQANLAYPSNNKPLYTKLGKYMYPETRRYVQKVYGTYRLLRTLDKVWRL